MAFYGYKENISAFLSATLLKQRLTVANSGYNVPGLNSTPFGHLPFPNLFVSFSGSAERIKDIKTKVLDNACANLQNVDNVKKQPGTFILASPTNLGHLQKLKGLVQNPKKSIQGTVSYKGLFSAARVYQCIAAFQMTNSYPAFKSDIEDVDNSIRSVLKRTFTKETIPEDLQSVMQKEPSGGRVAKAARSLGSSSAGRDATPGPEQEITHAVGIQDFVAVAKPGNGTLRSSMGLPKDCPKLPGIIFEYFPGMNSPDGPFIRDIMNTFFFRAFGDDPRAAFTEFKDGLGDFANTEEGMICAHILKCQEIALDAQCMVYIMFDGRSYLGSVVLGAKWALSTPGGWVEPKAASVIAAALDRIKTHSSSIEEIVEWLRGREITVTNEDISTGVKLAKVLSKVVWSGSGQELVKEKQAIDDLVRRLQFGTIDEKYTHKGMLDFLLDITDTTRSLELQHVCFPRPDDYPSLQSRTGLALTRFGSRVPSFVIPKPLLTRDLSKLKAGTQEALDGNKALFAGYKNVVIAMKPFSVAVKDMELFMKDRKFVEQSGERASIYKYHIVRDAKKDKLLEALVAMFVANPLDSTAEEGSKKKKGKERAEDVTDAQAALDFLDGL